MSKNILFEHWDRKKHPEDYKICTYPDGHKELQPYDNSHYQAVYKERREAFEAGQDYSDEECRCGHMYSEHNLNQDKDRIFPFQPECAIKGCQCKRMGLVE